MRKNMIFAAGILAMALSGCGIAGGGDKGAVPENVAVVVGNTANSAAPNLNVAGDLIQQACTTYGSVSLITVEGTPKEWVKVEIKENMKGISENKKESIARNQAAEIASAMSQCRAETPEADVLQSIALAGRTLHAEDGEKEMLILHSGIATIGAMDLKKTMLEEVDAAQLAADLKQEGQMPDLSGIHVTWAGLGDTSSPQQPLSEKNRKVLQDIWQKVLTEAGAEVLFRTDIASGDLAAQDLPAVTPVELLAPVSVAAKYEPEKPLVLADDVLSFKPGKAELLTAKNDIEEILWPVMEYMIGHPEHRLVLAGTTASAGTREELRKLSEQRCETVRNIMVEYGVREDQLLIRGLGFDNAFTSPDTDAAGKLIEAAASANRSVILMPEEAASESGIL